MLYLRKTFGFINLVPLLCQKKFFKKGNLRPLGLKHDLYDFLKVDTTSICDICNFFKSKYGSKMQVFRFLNSNTVLVFLIYIGKYHTSIGVPYVSYTDMIIIFMSMFHYLGLTLEYLNVELFIYSYRSP